MARALSQFSNNLVVILITILCLCVLDRLDIFHLHEHNEADLIQSQAECLGGDPTPSDVDFPPIETITVAAVACSNRSEGSADDDTIYNETAILLKSILISCKLHGVKNVDFHLFLEHKDMENYFLEKMQEFGIPGKDINIVVHFHSAVEAVPEKYWYHMIFHKRFRCGYVRAFFPRALPYVDSLIYLDTDIIVTGDITKLWSHLFKFKGQQLIAMGRNNEPHDKNYRAMDKRLFGDIPHIKPTKGLNSGVIVMNMTKMRIYKWEEKIQRLYDAYRHYNKRLTVQRVMNILLFFNPDLLYVFNCEFHFIHTHCEMGPTCTYLKDDPMGIHVLHGANSTFAVDRIFRPVYESYEKFDMTNGDPVNDLMMPIKQFYRDGVNESSNPCFHVFNENLYKHLNN